jgi:flagellar biosynthesis/type III secretory pathway chaperone
VVDPLPLSDAEKAAKRGRTVFAQRLADELEEILEMEFESLQKQDLERFEQLQGRKTDLLAELAGPARHQTSYKQTLTGTVCYQP